MTTMELNWFFSYFLSFVEKRVDRDVKSLKSEHRVTGGEFKMVLIAPRAKKFLKCVMTLMPLQDYLPKLNIVAHIMILSCSLGT